MKSVNVLLITPFYAPDLGPSVPIFTALCEDLAQLGCNVTVVTALPARTSAYADFGGGGQKPRKEENLNGVRVIRTPAFSASKATIWHRILHFAFFNLSSAISSLRIDRPDIVLSDSPTLWTGFPLLITALIGRIPFIYIIHDIYPDVLSRLSIIRNRHILDVIGRMESFYYLRSAHISVLTEGFKDNLLKKGVPSSKISIIPACVDTDFIRPLSRDNQLRRQWGLTDKFVVLYAGNLGLSQGLESALTTARYLSEIEDIVFVFVGDGVARAELQCITAKAGLNNVRFFPFLPREQVPLLYALADVSLILLKGDIVAESIPSKTYTIMASGRPIVASVNPQTEVAALINLVKCGFCTPPENPTALAEAIISLHENPSICEQMGLRGREHAVANYSRKRAASQYFEAIQHFANSD